MSNVQSTVFVALQTNDETRPIVEAIERDNPRATVTRMPAMVKIDAPNRLVVRRETVEDITGMEWDLQAFQINLISLSGNVEENDEELVLHWNR
ncbi:MAG: MmoB/DmpM family protein [Thauera sp.]|nr:MmoB/DmpM family protein [Thauera sp.]